MKREVPAYAWSCQEVESVAKPKKKKVYWNKISTHHRDSKSARHKTKSGKGCVGKLIETSKS